jgi:hypothetical protein
MFMNPLRGRVKRGALRSWDDHSRAISQLDRPIDVILLPPQMFSISGEVCSLTLSRVYRAGNLPRCPERAEELHCCDRTAIGRKTEKCPLQKRTC